MSVDRYMDLANKATRRVLGRPVAFTPASTGVAVNIKAIFDAAHDVIEYQDGLPVSSKKPVLHVRLADLDLEPVKGDTLVVAETSYRVTDVQVDGHGGADLILRKVTA